jgi:hypothetical protein
MLPHILPPCVGGDLTPSAFRNKKSWSANADNSGVGSLHIGLLIFPIILIPLQNEL